MTTLDRLAKVELTGDGARFNRFSCQIVRIGTTVSRPSFFNTATKTHDRTIQNAIVVKTGVTRVLPEDSMHAGAIRCASDDGVRPAPYVHAPLDDLCAICPHRDRECVATTPTIIVSREGSRWRVLRLEATGDNAARLRAWEQRFFVDWDLEHEAGISIGLNAQRSVELRLEVPRRLSRQRSLELLALYQVLQLLPLPAAMTRLAR